MMRNNLFSLKNIGLLLCFGLAGCGAGEDPLELINPSLTPIRISLPFSGTALLNTAFTNATPYFSWTLAAFGGTQANVISPAGGVVTDTNGANGLFDVEIRVNSRFSVKVGSMTTLARFREGDPVTTGDVIGTTTGVVTLTVYEDGVETCPLARLNESAATGFTYGAITTAVCQ
jgi:hypothetical protein